jgi:hypothetical protein
MSVQQGTGRRAAPARRAASGLGLAPAEVTAVTAARDQLGRFSSIDELSVYANLPPDRLDGLRDWLLFGLPGRPPAGGAARHARPLLRLVGCFPGSIFVGSPRRR